MVIFNNSAHCIIQRIIIALEMTPQKLFWRLLFSNIGHSHLCSLVLIVSNERKYLMMVLIIENLHFAYFHSPQVFAENRGNCEHRRRTVWDMASGWQTHMLHPICTGGRTEPVSWFSCSVSLNTVPISCITVSPNTVFNIMYYSCSVSRNTAPILYHCITISANTAPISWTSVSVD